MRMLLILALAVSAAPDRPDLTPKQARLAPHEQILGDWLYVGNGQQPMQQPPGRTMGLRITPTDSIWLENNQPSPGNGFTAKIAFDWTKNPVTWDMKPGNGSGAIIGILKLDGDRLIIAWPNGGQARPTEFNPTPQVHVHHFTRIRK